MNLIINVLWQVRWTFAVATKPVIVLTATHTFREVV